MKPLKRRCSPLEGKHPKVDIGGALIDMVHSRPYDSIHVKVMGAGKWCDACQGWVDRMQGK